MWLHSLLTAVPAILAVVVKSRPGLLLDVVLMLFLPYIRTTTSTLHSFSPHYFCHFGSLALCHLSELYSITITYLILPLPPATIIFFFLGMQSLLMLGLPLLHQAVSWWVCPTLVVPACWTFLCVHTLSAYQDSTRSHSLPPPSFQHGAAKQLFIQQHGGALWDARKIR